MPTSITFFYHDEDFQKPTMTVFADGTWKEHGLPFLRRRSCVVRIEKRGNHGPSRKQLDAVKLISSYAIENNPYCLLIYKCFTSPWALDAWAKNKHLAQLAGPGLPGKRRFTPTPVKNPSQVVRDARGNMPMA
ncbi:hypothetical protein GWG65_36090 [Bradyrhizobium sp. CSA207]|uniref:hypothetical protein n=1 Tax=Bradyrhizobium sp. CSA207 TaxID=2698826 RepID=UPI0023B1B422|nr:hypothetical protein [Bradyrhizobium sp. CSA207]MDE5446687.1 hypothetical protein [Bradyrhizobium sp. CSA207]